MGDKLRIVVAVKTAAAEFTNISGEALRCKITAGDGTAVSFVAYPGMTFTVDNWPTVPKVEADYISD